MWLSISRGNIMQEILILKVNVSEDAQIDDVILEIGRLNIVDYVELIEEYKED